MSSNPGKLVLTTTVNTPAGLSYWTASEEGTPVEQHSGAATPRSVLSVVSSPSPGVKSLSSTSPILSTVIPRVLPASTELSLSTIDSSKYNTFHGHSPRPGYRAKNVDPLPATCQSVSKIPLSLNSEIYTWQPTEPLALFGMISQLPGHNLNNVQAFDSQYINVGLAARVSQTHLTTEKVGGMRDVIEVRQDDVTHGNVVPSSQFAAIDNEMPDSALGGPNNENEVALFEEAVLGNDTMDHRDVTDSQRGFAGVEPFLPISNVRESTPVQTFVSKPGSDRLPTNGSLENGYTDGPSDNASEDGNTSEVEIVITEDPSSANDTDTLIVIGSAEYEHALKKLKLDIPTARDDLDRALRFAAKTGDVHLVTSLIHRGARINSRSKYGMTACHYATYMGYTDVLVALLDNGASTNCVEGEMLFRTCGHNLSIRNPHPIHIAALRGHFGILRVLLKGCEWYDSLKEHEFDFLKWSINSGPPEVARLLLDRRGDVNFLDSESLQLSTRIGHGALLRLLLETEKVDVNSRDDIGRTALHLAAMNGQDAIVRLLLETNKIDVNARDNIGRTALHLAAVNGQDTIVRLLLETDNVDVNSRGDIGRTALHLVAMNGQDTIVRLLLETDKIDINLRDAVGRTALYLATINGQDTIVRLLLETDKVDVNTKINIRGLTPLHLAAKSGHETIARLLLETGKIDVNSRGDDHGWTPLHLAAKSGHEAIARLLLETGKIDANLRTYSNNWTPLHFAAKSGNEAIARLLLEIGKVDVNLRDYDHGWTPLHVAAENGREIIVKLLLETGKVDVNSRNNHGWTPLHLAAEYGYKTIVRLLLETGKVDAYSRNYYRDWEKLHLCS